MSEVEVGFRTVFGYVNFPVFERVHGSRIDVHIRIQFLHGDAVAALSKQSAERRRDYAFAQSGNDAARNEYVLCSVHNFFSFEVNF